MESEKIKKKQVKDVTYLLFISMLKENFTAAYVPIIGLSAMKGW